MNFQQIEITMKDLLNNKEVKRTVDISVIYFDNGTCWEVEQNPERQEALINEWIEDRANDQHETILELIDYTIF